MKKKPAKKQSRLLINVFGAPIIIATIIAGDNSFPFFSLFMLIVMLGCAYEVNTLLEKTKIKLSIPFIFTSVTLIQIFRSYDIFYNYIDEFIILLVTLSMLYEMARSSSVHLLNISVLMFTFCWIGIGLGTSVDIRKIESYGVEYGLYIILIIFLSVWLCDSAAYIFGKKFGKRKIASMISPNKTLLGSTCGFLAVLFFLISLYMYDLFYLRQICNENFFHLIALSIIFGIGSQFGDLVESLFKRDASIKDSGTILRGHGGFLDRFDSLLFVVPLSWIYITNYLTHL